MAELKRHMDVLERVSESTPPKTPISEAMSRLESICNDECTFSQGESTTIWFPQLG